LTNAGNCIVIALEYQEMWGGSVHFRAAYVPNRTPCPNSSAENKAIHTSKFIRDSANRLLVSSI